jgi:serine/threonine protein kinase
VHEVMSKYAKSLNNHRNICRIIDYEVSEFENNIYVISESYNLCLFDLYCTFQAEKTILSEDFLIETSFQILKALEHLNRQGSQGGFQGMLRMQNILFDENGSVKIQEMSHLHFDEYEIRESDLIFLPPEVLKGGARRQKGQITNSKFQINCSMDVWTLGMILLHCLCLEYKKAEYETNTFDEILSLYLKVKGPSLITFEEKEEIEESRSKKDHESFSENSADKEMESP